MSRCHRAFDRRYQELLGELRARDRGKGLAWFHRQASLHPEATTANHAHTELLIALLRKVHRFRAHHRSSQASATAPCRVYCDAGLGGLARWLRASGYEALWTQDITD